jgi:hypothetical protein
MAGYARTAGEPPALPGAPTTSFCGKPLGNDAGPNSSTSVEAAAQHRFVLGGLDSPVGPELDRTNSRRAKSKSMNTSNSSPQPFRVGTACGVAAAATFVSENVTVVRPLAAALTVYGPPVSPFAVNAAAATPDALVITVIVVALLAKTPDGPLLGAVNVTLTPATGALPASLTVTARACAKAVFTAADCGVVPAFAAMDDAIPDVTVSTVDPVTPPNVALIVLVPVATAVANPLLLIVAVNGVPDAQVT